MTAYLKLEHVDMTFTRGAADDRGAARTSTSTIEQGEFVSIIGHSGCGKSTLLNIVAGLLTSTTGGVLLENKEVERARPRPRRGVPEPFAAALAHRLRERQARASTRCSAGPRRSGRAPRLGHAQSRPRADGPRQGQAPARDLRRHEAARRHRPRAGDGAEGAAARRAVRRARRADPRPSAGLGDGDPSRSSATRC